MTRLFLVHILEKFMELLCARALRRSLIDYHAANCLSLAGGVRGLWFLSSVPRTFALRRIACLALESYLPGEVARMQAEVHVYSGSNIKGDGNRKLANRIVANKLREEDDTVGRFHWHRPYSNVQGWTGVDGALLKPVTGLATEDMSDVLADLGPLMDVLAENRRKANLPPQAIPPVSHSTDVYGKTRKKLRAFYSRKFGTPAINVLAPTPKGPAASVTVEAPRDCPTEPAADSHHSFFEVGLGGWAC